jgi:hypothetical protein
MQYYQLDKRTRHHRRFWITTGVLCVVGLGWFITYRLLHTTTTPSSTIHNAPPVSTIYNSNSTAKVHIDRPLFTVDLPIGWQATAVTANVNVPTYSFISPSAQAQRLDLYIDNVPHNMAVNRAVAVVAKGAGLDHENVSDNCATFTPATNAATGVSAGKWQGTDFLCDEGNFERDVVGTASTEGLNTISLTGPTVGSHKIFMAYANNNVNPDFAALYTILESFTLK